LRHIDAYASFHFPFKPAFSNSVLHDVSTPRTPLIHNEFEKALTLHPNRLSVAILLDTIRNGANICYNGPRHNYHTQDNHRSSLEHKEFINDEINSDIAKGRTAGWYDFVPFTSMRFHPLGCVPKTLNGKPIGLRKITDASFPVGNSLNDNILPLHCPNIHWRTVVSLLHTAGKGTIMFKRDIKAAFRTIMLRAADQPLHGISWLQRYAYELSLTFGVRSSPAIWERVATAIQWIMESHGLLVSHHVDDFIIICPPGRDASADIKLFDSICAQLGIPLAEDKKEGPLTSMVYCGIIINTIDMTLSITPERKLEIITLLTDAVRESRRSMSYPKLASIVGKLVFVSRVLPAGRAFSNNILHGLSRVNGHGPIKFNQSIRHDFRWWLKWLPSWDGIGIIPNDKWIDASTITLFTDASESGWGIVCGNEWMYGEWSPDERKEAVINRHRSMPYYELYALAIAALHFGHLWNKQRISFQCDCAPVVHSINSGHTRSRIMSRLLRVISDSAVRYKFEWRCHWIAGSTNSLADPLSRGDIQEFRRRHGSCHLTPMTYHSPPIMANSYLNKSS
jgi:hypothetical protein